jgi:asparagine synthase (glutamine-hydrolysing)
MCGIAGVLAFADSTFHVTEPYLVRMRDALAHRGPDGAGLWIAPDRRVGFGHRRLSIIDLATTAGQPMSNEDDSLWVTFNGEIYNHAEIRKELSRTNKHRWKTDHSDTEVILHAFEEWGIECLQKFRGMFAIALWDASTRSLWLIRDRIGIKPLYYSIHHGRLTFASEIKALLRDPEQERAVNEEAFYHYLSYLTTPAPETLFAGIRKLPSGSWLRIRESGEMTEHRYWDVWDHTQPMTGATEQEIAERLLAELRTAVQLRKVSDVPVGVFLSGGIDSSTNAALFSEGESKPIKTFTIGYDEDYPSCQNELHFARRMAERVHAEHHELRLTVEDLVKFLPRMVYLQDEPIADPVCVPVHYVSELARKNNVTVCQLGEGADELFWGYHHWRQALYLQKWLSMPLIGGLKRLGMLGLALMGKRDTRWYEWLRRSCHRLPIFWSGAEAFPAGPKERVLSPRLRRQFRGRSSWEPLAPIWERFQAKAWEKSELHWMSYVDLNLRLPELLLMRVDKMSMGVALEGRVPFLDHKFVELVLSIPEAAKTRHGITKYIFKKAVRGVIPDELIDRPKQGFAVPIHEWFLSRFGPLCRTEIKRLCNETDYFDCSEVMRLLDNGHGDLAWYILNFALWWKEFIR